MITLLLAGLLMLQAPRDAASPQSATGTGQISGTVITGEAARPVPLRRAIVTVSGTGIIGMRQVVTDDQGRFVIDALPAGRFTLTAEKAGFLTTYVGSRRPGRPPSTPLALVEGQRMTNLSVYVAPGAAIEGTVRDEKGRPIAAAQVSAWSQEVVDGQQQFEAATGRASRVLADDRGHFRLWGLLPGTYVVEATGSSGTPPGAEYLTDDGSAIRMMARGTAYAPGVSRAADATLITLATGEERAGVDIVNPMFASSTLTLILSTDLGQPVTNVAIGIASLASRRLTSSLGAVRPDANGRVTVPALAPGRYLFLGRSTAAAPADPPLWMRSEVEVGTTDAEVAVTLNHGPKVSGAIIADSGSQAWSGVLVTLVSLPDIPGTSTGNVGTRTAADGSFEFAYVPAGRYSLTATLPNGAKLASAMLDGKDILDYPLEVRDGHDVTGLRARISASPTNISGRVVDQLGRPSPEFSVVVFAAEPELRRASTRRNSGLVKIASDGTYTVDNLPPGDYLLAVIVDADPRQLQDRSFLEQVALGAIPLRLTEGQRVVQDLKVGG